MSLERPLQAPPQILAPQEALQSCQPGKTYDIRSDLKANAKCLFGHKDEPHTQASMHNLLLHAAEQLGRLKYLRQNFLTPDIQLFVFRRCNNHPRHFPVVVRPSPICGYTRVFRENGTRSNR